MRRRGGERQRDGEKAGQRREEDRRKFNPCKALLTDKRTEMWKRFGPSHTFTHIGGPGELALISFVYFCALSEVSNPSSFCSLSNTNLLNMTDQKTKTMRIKIHIKCNHYKFGCIMNV